LVTGFGGGLSVPRRQRTTRSAGAGIATGFGFGGGAYGERTPESVGGGGGRIGGEAGTTTMRSTRRRPHHMPSKSPAANAHADASRLSNSTLSMRIPPFWKMEKTSCGSH
jgi:hypothetical protein